MDDDFDYVSPSGKVITRMGCLPEGEIAHLRAEIERLTKERDALFLENGKLANTLGAECLRLRATLKGVEIALTRDEDIAGAINLIVTYEQSVREDG